MEAKLDHIDRKIVALLRDNARRSISQIASSVGRSRAVIYDRIAKLEKLDVIRGFTVIETGKQSSFSPLSAYFLIKLAHGRTCAMVAQAIEGIGEITKSQSITGEVDMILFTELESMERMANLRQQLENIPGVQDVTTLHILMNHFDRTHSPLVEPR